MGSVLTFTQLGPTGAIPCVACKDGYYRDSDVRKYISIERFEEIEGRRLQEFMSQISEFPNMVK